MKYRSGKETVVVFLFFSSETDRSIMRTLSLSFCLPFCLVDAGRIRAKNAADISPACCLIFFSNFRRSVFCRPFAADWIYSESFGVPFFVVHFIDASSIAALALYVRV